ncbi:polyglutamine-binding protein 1 [Strongylocentrotus purpuratus]|uniref:Polyglutamine-binding protein 1 n=1 Tax=Strongylocentrotus purpuratus TaxID=7668 RepID=A0A7M7MYV8_STRPU|nr:polyglutamine-binding protein 1 [Strongylocentrotus purpuratus]
MSLPPALAARLKKRGILKAGSTNLENDPTEEIIAADYSGDIQPDLSKEQIIIDNDSLPHGWWKVKDPPSGFVYYWDSNTDMVSWLSPIDSKANISLSANKLREIEEKRIRLREAQPKPPGMEPADKVKNVEIGPVIGPVIPSSVPLPPPKNPPPRSGGERSRRDHRGSRGRRQKEDELDPMDPSAYSDTPRGNWSSGLPTHQEAKTGVDVTASGPLFQMRPYPSPGAILRANKANANT